MKNWILLVLWLPMVKLGHCGDVPEYTGIEERGGWNFETTRLKHGIRLNRRTWIEDPTKVTYDLFIEGKHLWAIIFENDRVLFVPVLIRADEHILTQLESKVDGQYTLDLVTPDRSGYIGSITFHKKTASVTIASNDELKRRITEFQGFEAELYSGTDFEDPEYVYAGSLPKPIVPEGQEVEVEEKTKKQNKAEMATPRKPSD